jgi:hypothetical protein
VCKSFGIFFIYKSYSVRIQKRKKVLYKFISTCVGIQANREKYKINHKNRRRLIMEIPNWRKDRSDRNGLKVRGPSSRNRIHDYDSERKTIIPNIFVDVQFVPYIHEVLEIPHYNASPSINNLKEEVIMADSGSVSGN